jgi:hypothetical protein
LGSSGSLHNYAPDELNYRTAKEIAMLLDPAFMNEDVGKILFNQYGA